jgi:asparagine synthase (glutamine-hydrolysing)
MCGIVGLAGRLSRERLTAEVEAMNAAVAHRGPDDEGTWVGENFAFGMRRLSIIDLASGHQPMWDDGTGLGIVYNGEVYNYKSVRAGLEKKGISFKTTSDTEVVLKSLALKGAEAIHDWNGMFAVAAWNDRDKKLLLIRDRVGVKPLYYYWDGRILMFASEIKALLSSTLVQRRVNLQAAWDYLTYRYVPGPETIWQNIWKLPPGHMLEWSQDREPRISRYWKTDVVSKVERTDIEQKTKEFEDLFLDAVELRLLASDVPVGVMLSGGLDSSCVAAAAVELGHKRFHTFSVGFSDGGAYSELGFAHKVAEHLGVDYHEVVVDQSRFMEMLPEAVRATDEPLADLTIVPLLAVSRLACEHVKVVLSGEGADEILAGYNLDKVRQHFETIKRLQTLPAGLLKPLSQGMGLLSNRYGDALARAASVPLSKWNLELKNHMTWTWNENEKGALWPSFMGRDSDFILEGMYGAASSPDPFDQLLSVYQQSWLVEDLLMKADKITMAASLELRVPFLDYRLVEWANRQPTDVKVGRVGRHYVTKNVLRRFAQKRLPAEILERPKQGFPVPVNRWLTDEGFRKSIASQLTGEGAKVTALFSRAEIERQLGQSSTGDSRAADRVWLLVILETWLKQYGVELESAAPSEAEVATSGVNRLR